ncbi:autotransporter-associated beta strand repeat-containing protein [Variovorax paradoxus]|uniref:autotransporter-associated beta strand repeat-containing protein n=1 Tax=Variovorax paradoxus TaxID=34073 RepID=UPI001ABBF730
MNVVYKTIWNAALGAWVAVCETARARGKRSGGRRALAGASLVAPLLGVPLFLLSGTASAVCTLAGNVLTCTGTTPGWVSVSNGGTINNSGEIAKLGDGTWGIYTGANITINNTGTISGTSGVVIGGNAVINNDGGIIRSTDRAIQVTGGPVTLTNSNGGIIEGLAGALIYGGGTIVNTGNSRISSTGNYLGLGFGGGSASITNTLGSTISGAAASIYGQATSLTLDNGGLLQGSAIFDGGLVQRVTLRVGSRIVGDLSIGSKTGSTLTLTGAGTQIYSQAATGTTTFGGDLFKEDSGDWVINRPMAPRTATVNAGALGFASGGTFGAGTALSLAAAGTLLHTDSGNAAVGNLSGVAGSKIALAAGSSLRMADGTSTTIASDFSGGGALIKSGSGTLTLSGNNSGFSGSFTANAGTLLAASAKAIGGAALDIGGDVTLMSPGALALNAVGLSTSTGAGVLSVQTPGAVNFNGTVSGAGSLDLRGIGGKVSLLGANSYAGGTRFANNTVVLGSNTALGAGTVSIEGDTSLSGTAALTLGNAFAIGKANLLAISGPTLTLNGQISGDGGIVKQGAATLTLGGASTYTGGTTVTAGTLSINNKSGSATGTGAVQVQSGATLMGSGAIAGPVNVAAGAKLAVGNGGVGALTTGALTLAAGSTLEMQLGKASVVGGAFNDLLTVNGNLSLAGTLNLAQSAGGSFSAGIYRLINYTGTLTANAMTIGSAPTPLSYLTLQTNTANQVNLVNTGGLTLNLWDGSSAAAFNNGQVEGGSGTWRAGSPGDNWTDANGLANGTWVQDGFAVFSGKAGTVTVANNGAGGAVRIGGAQFAVNGYTINGDPLTINAANTVVRVGDGTAASAGMTATIAAAIGGTGGLVKDDGGVLIVSGKNSYTGGTTVKGGILQFSADNNLGAAGKGLALDGGTLRIATGSGSLASARALALGAGGGTIDLGNSTWGFGGAIGGNGALSVTGKGGVLNLAVASSYKGGTVVQGGASVNAGASGAFGSGAVLQQGSGTRVSFLNAASAGGNSYTVGRAGIADSDNRLVFTQNSTAGSAAIDVNGAGGQSATANAVQFGDTSSAGTSTIGNLGGAVSFQQSASAGSATISNGANSLVSFADSATAGSSKIANAKGGTVYFAESSTGANATLTNAAGGVVDVSGVTAKTGLSLGALSGAGNVVLGATRLTLGGLNASGTISGIVSDKGSAFAQPGAGTGGSVVKVGSGTLALSGANTYTGGTTVAAGTLAANNASGSATGTGAVQVQSGGTLAGTGSIAGTVSVAKGGVLSAGNAGVGGGAGTLTLGGLNLASGAVLDYDLGQAGVAGGSLNDLVNVNGNLQLDGTLNVAQTAGGKFGAGLYRLINYTGTLTDNGLDIGTAPTSTANLQVQTSIANQVNLLNASGLTLNLWDGASSANINDGKVSGGSGTWRAGGPSTNWTGVDGKLNASWQQGGFAIFAGKAGTVTVDNTGPGGAVRMGGAQFAVSGYTVNGSALTIDAPATVVRVGDGTAASTGMSATIAAAIGGAGGLVKDDGGTLVLSGKNSYGGGTTVKAGVLRISSDANLGAASGDLALDGGTLGIAVGSGPLSTTRDIALGTGGGTLDLANNAYEVDGAVSGKGALTVTGKGGTLLLSKTNSFSGGTSLRGGAGLTAFAAGALGSGDVRQVDSDTTLVFSTGGSAGSNNYIVGTAGVSGGNTLAFAQNATAAAAKIALFGAGWQDPDRNSLQFLDGAVGASATINNKGAAVVFAQKSSAGSATFTNGANSLLSFIGASSAAKAAIDNQGGMLQFADTATGTTSTVVKSTGTVDVSGSTAKTGVELGSLSGSGAVVLGATRLTVGGFGGSDALSGVVSDKGSVFAQPGSGTGGSIVKVGAGTLTLSGANTYTGGTTVAAGTLSVSNKSGSATGTGAVQVQSGATLAGTGTIAGTVTVANGGAVNPGNGAGTLTVGGLALNAGSVLNYQLGQAGVAGGTLNDLINVNGNLRLDGTLNVAETAGGKFGAGLYRLINYTGTLTNNGLDIGTAPSDTSKLFVQTSVDNQVNLLNTNGLVLNLWDGGNAANVNDGKIAGGTGTWRAGGPGDYWTDANGLANGTWVQDGFAVFAGKAGTVTVDNKGAGGAVRIGGAQFAVDGYTVDGAALTMNTPGSVIRVGDGTAAGAGMSATINAALTGTGGLVKDDLGTLVLGGSNSYAGGTTVKGGVLQITADANLGKAGTGLGLDGGTLRIGAGAANFVSTRAVALGTGGGTVDLGSNSFGIGGAVSGKGALTVTGKGGTLSLAQAGSYSGGTVLRDGAAITTTASGALGSGAVLQQGNDTSLTLLGSASGGSNSYTVGRAGSSDDGNMLLFGQTATAAAANIVVNGKGWQSATTNELQFGTSAGAGSATLANAGGVIRFVSASSAGTATISNGDKGLLAFAGAATAGSAKIANASGGLVAFFDSASGAKSTLANAAGGVVDVSVLTSKAGIELGSLSGAGGIVLGATQLTLGGLNAGDTISGVVSDKGSVFAQPGSGTGGSIVKVGSGTLSLSGANTYTGGTTVAGGTLATNNTSGSATGTGAVQVQSGATLAGTGSISGAVNIAKGGVLSAGNGGAGTLTVGSLSLANGAVLNYDLGQAGVAGGALNDLVNVNGNLQLDGTLNVAQSKGGVFGAGIYRLINYTGGLTDNGLDIGTAPGSKTDLQVQTSVAQQVNLVNRSGLSLNFWDGSDASKYNDGQVAGGSGTWRVGVPGDSWTGADGKVNAAWVQNQFAVFGGVAGTVDVDDGNGTVRITGAQFATNGYRVQGDAIELGNAATTVRVGDGSAAGAGMTGTIASSLTGAGGLVKDDLGTLVLGGANSYAGGTTIKGGILQIASDASLGAAAGSLALEGTTLRVTGDTASARTVSLGAGSNSFDIDAARTLALNGAVSGPGSLRKIGTGTLRLGEANNYAGGTFVDAGTLAAGVTGALGSGAASVASGATVQLDGGFNAGTMAIGNQGTVRFQDKTNAGTSTITNAKGGVLAFADDASANKATVVNQAGAQVRIDQASTGVNIGALGGAGNVLLGAKVLTTGGLNTSTTLSGTVSGVGGSVIKVGSGTLSLSGANTYTGGTTVAGGTLAANNTGGSATGSGAVRVQSGATLAGTGNIAGAVNVAKGGVLSAGNGGAGTLTVGSLSLAEGSVLNYDLGQAGVAGGALNDLVNVNGNLQLDGTLNVAETAGGKFGAGIYRLMNYTGGLTDNGLDIGSAPSAKTDLQVQTSVAQQVNLVNRAGLSLNFWDGGDASKYNDGQVAGGSGTWRVGVPGDGWTGADGKINAAWVQDQFAVFGSSAGTVDVDDGNGTVRITGAQFATNGYRVQGDAIELGNAATTVRVGDGSAAGAGMTATIASSLTGAGGLVKEDLGTLVLDGSNSYSGGTTIKGGVLQIASDANLGAAAGGLALEGTTLHVTGDTASKRAVSLGAGNNNFDIDKTVALNGTVSGAGSLRKIGAGTLRLGAANNYAGGTFVDVGTLATDVTGSLGSGAASVASDAILQLDGAFDAGTTAIGNQGTVRFQDTASAGTSTITNAAGGVLAFADDASASKATVLNQAGAQLRIDQASTGVNVGALGGAGDVLLGAKALTTGGLNASTTVSGTIGGAGGSVIKVGNGALELSGANTYTGGTTVAGGTLAANNASGSATGTGGVQVQSGATLAGTGSIAGTVNVAKGGVLSAGNGGAGTLTLGSLSLAEGSVLNYDLGQAGVAGGVLNDLVNVNGNLQLDGTLNVAETAGGKFGAGIYRLMNYTGGLTDNGLDIGSTPSAKTDLQVQTSVAQQVNLVNRAGLSLNFWDGGDASKYNDGQVAGGSGTWRVGVPGDGWTGADGKINAAWVQDQFAVFGSSAGTVDVDDGNGTVRITGAQFATNGYRVQGDAIELGNAATTVRVGDGSAAGTGMSATVASSLTGAGGLIKEDLGTLVLDGSNSYSGGTTIKGGVLQIASDANLGAAVGGLALEGTTLHVTGDTASKRAVSLGTGSNNFDIDKTVALNGTVSGAGSLRKTGAGTLQLGAANAYVGGTEVAAGSVEALVTDALGTGPVSVAGNASLAFTNTADASKLAITLAKRGSAPTDNGGFVAFRDSSSAGNATITANQDASVEFRDTSSAGSSVIENRGGSTTLWFNAEGGKAQITNFAGGRLDLLDDASAGQARLVNENGGVIGFADRTSADQATVVNNAGGQLRIGSLTNAGVGIGSLEGAGEVLLGTKVLTTGGLNTSTTLSGTISGNGGSVVKVGSGTLELSGANTYTGGTAVAAGTLAANNASGSATGTGAVQIQGGATLAGNGSIAGAVNIAKGGVLSAGNGGVGTLTLGSLSLADGAVLNYDLGQANTVGGPLNDLVNVNGNLQLDGTLNVAQSTGGSFGAGLYRLISYTGSLTDNGLDIGTAPGAAADLQVQTSVAQQVNLVNRAGLSLNFWDGSDASKYNDGLVAGGNGTWRVGVPGDGWTGADGKINAAWAQGQFAVFGGSAGTVTVSNAGGTVRITGAQFATNGYRVQGDEIELGNAATTVRVGDGTNAGTGMTATIASSLTGAGGLVKDDLGTLVLDGSNSYSGGTTIKGGILQIASDANLGAAAGGLALEGTTLRVTGDTASVRTVSLGAGSNRFDVDAARTLALNGSVSGAGSLRKIGAGSLRLGAANAYDGGTFVDAGTLVTDVTGALGSGAASVASGATLQLGGGFDAGTTAIGNQGTVRIQDRASAGTSTITNAAGGVLAFADDASADKATVLNQAGAQVRIDQASSGVNVGALGGAGDVLLGAKALTTGGLNTSTTVSGTISGNGGSVVKVGSGTLDLSGANTYTDGTTVAGGALAVNNASGSATGTGGVQVQPGAMLVGNGSVSGAVSIAKGGVLSAGNAGVGTLTLGGLNLADGAVLNYDLGQSNTVGGALNDRVQVNGNLQLDGTLNVAQSKGGVFGAGIYRLIDYTGSLMDNGLDIGSAPIAAKDLQVQTSVVKQVNLVNRTGLSLNFWDGGDNTKYNDGKIAGGTGTWRVGVPGDGWTGTDGKINAAWAQDQFAVFGGTGGTVTVSNAGGTVRINGAQFAADGYVLQGDAIELGASGTVVRVGDGSGTDVDRTATVNVALTGAGGLVKDDVGRLILGGTNTYTGGTTVKAGVLQGSTASLQSGIINDAEVVFDQAKTGSYAGTMSGSGKLRKIGVGTLTLTSANSYAGGTFVDAGTLATDVTGALGSGAASVASGATLQFGGKAELGSMSVANSGTVRLQGNASAGNASLVNASGAVLAFADDATADKATVSNAAGAQVRIDQVTTGVSIGTLDGAGDIALGAKALTLGGLNGNATLSGAIDGNGGSIVKVGSGTLTLTGANTYTGGTTVGAGTLSVNNKSGSATGTGAVQVQSGATLAGSGSIAGAVTIDKGGILAAGNSPGTLTLGALTLAGGSTLNYELGQAGVPGGALNDLINVTGNLNLDGTLNIAQSTGGSFGPGLYRLMSYGGSFTDNGLDIGTVPGSAKTADLQVQTSVANQVNLVNRAGLSLNFWDGGDSTKYNDGQVAGGSGTWRVGNPQPSMDGWTDMDGKLNANWAQNQFAVFGGKAGTVTVDAAGGAVRIAGAQFATDGYVVQGDGIVVDNANSVIRVGDGTAAGATMTATLNVALSGTGGISKEDAGRLILGGTNTYTGGTTVKGGVLQGSATSLQGNIVNNAEVAFDQGKTAGTYAGVMSGTGKLRKIGTGALTLASANSYSGGTLVDAGTLTTDTTGALGTGPASIASGATLQFGGKADAGKLAIANAGTLRLQDTASAAGATVTNAAGGQVRIDLTTTGTSIGSLSGAGDVVLGAKTLTTGAIGGDNTISGAITGTTGSLVKVGAGTLTLAGTATYAGETRVTGGTLKAGATNAFSAASSAVVASGATLDLGGFSQKMAGLTNAGTVSLLGTVPGTTLTLTGPYVGNNGVLRLGAKLDKPGIADRLVLDGASASASGKTTVQVTNLGGLGARTSGAGIELISAKNGATTTAQSSKDAFVLSGGRVDAGAYEYRLYAGDAGGEGENWYLRTEAEPGASLPTYRAEASLFAALPNQLRQSNLGMLASLSQRIGDDDVRGSGGASTSVDGSNRRAWGRLISTDMDIRQGGTVSPHAEGRVSGLQAGTDLWANPNWRAGIYVGQLEGDTRVSGSSSGLLNTATGRNDLRSQYLGLYGTFTSDDGFYADAVLQAGRHRYTVQPQLSAGVTGKGNSLLASIEVGKAFALGTGGWSVEPQLQLIHQRLRLDDVAIPGALVQQDADSSWTARAGVRIKGSFATGAGTLQPYARLNVYRSSKGNDVARFVNPAAITPVGAPIGGTSTELAAGFTLALSQRTSLYGELGKQWASGGVARVGRSVNAGLGIRVKW